MSKLVSGFLVGILFFLSGKMLWEKALENAIQDTITERNNFWKKYCDGQLAEEQEYWAAIRSRDQRRFEAKLDSVWNEAFQQGMASGKQQTERAYQARMIKLQDSLSTIRQSRDSLVLIVRRGQRKSSSVQKVLTSTVGNGQTVSGKGKPRTVRSDRTTSTLPDASSLSTLVLYVVAMILLVLLITLMILRWRAGNRRRRFRL